MSRDIYHRPGRQTHLFVILALCALGISPEGVDAVEPVQWTLSEALEKAFVHSPVLRVRRAEVAEVRGRLLGARTYPHNPELAVEVADRSRPGVSTTDRGLSLSQELELAHQRRRRIALADEELAAVEADLQHERRLLAFRVESAFAEAVHARELLVVAQTDAALAREVLDFSQRRLDRGAATQIEVNLARASAGRAERSVQRARAAYASAQSRLSELAGLDPAAPPEPVGALELPEGELPNLADLLREAVERRGDLRAARRRVEGAEAGLRLARAERLPNLILEGFFQREEGTENIAGAAVSVSLPIFNRNQGPIAEALATRDRLRHEEEVLRLSIEREVATALNELRAARAATELLRDQVIETLDENVELLQRSFAAGRIGAAEVVTLRREFVASRREYLEALADAWKARIAVDLASGRLTWPGSLADEELP